MSASVSDNLRSILAEIAASAIAAGRSPEEVKLVAVSKTYPIAPIREAFEAGQVDFGENRVQEMAAKQPDLPLARWHQIGPLQRNKVKYIAPFVHLIHSVDSEKLMEEINRQAEKYQRTIEILLQLNISEEDSKSGIDEAGAALLLEVAPKYPHVKITGLMGMAAFTDDHERVRAQFRRLRVARDTFAAADYPSVTMKELSMGMSGDFDLAIAEGATLVRIGSAIFGSR